MNTDIPIIQKNELVFLSRNQFDELFKRLMNSYHYNWTQVLENAGRNLAMLARHIILEQDHPEGKILIFSGKDKQSACALTAARFLHLWGFRCRVITPDAEADFRALPRKEINILKRIGIPISYNAKQPEEERAELIIDGLIGYSLNKAPAEKYSNLIRWMNDFPANILSLDIPSGLDADEGMMYHPFTKAFATLTLAMPKRAFLLGDVRNYTGRVYLGDISVPWKLYSEMEIPLPNAGLFSRSGILQLRFGD